MKNKILSLILTLCMLLSMFPFVVGTSAADTVTAEIEISTADQLIELMATAANWSKNIVLKNDIDLTGKTGQTPIGNATEPFTGTFIGELQAVVGTDGKTTYRNPVISGINLSGTDNVGLFGVAKNATIKNLTLEGNITATGNKVGGFVGYVTGGTLDIENCVNKCALTVNVAGKGYIGGIVGFAQKAGAVTISDCTNDGPVTGCTQVGGIIGRIDSPTGDTTIIRCHNNKAVSAGANAAAAANGFGGIVGLLVTASNSTVQVSIKECWNSADVTGAGTAKSNAGHTGGMLGSVKTSGTKQLIMEDCINTGDITSGHANGYVGGMIGYAYPSPAFKALVQRCYNAGSIKPVGATFTKQIAGVPRASDTAVYADNYYRDDASSEMASDDLDTTAVTLTDSIDGNKALFPALAASTWLFSVDGPMLRTFHDHKYADGVCTICGEDDPAFCKHKDKEYITIVPATCVSEGRKNLVCTNPDCGKVLETDVPIEKDPTNHVNGLLWYVNEAGTYSYGCPACGIEPLATQETLPTIYINSVSGNDANTGFEESAPVKSFENAVRCIGQTGGTISSTGRIAIGSDITLPEHTGTITVTSSKPAANGDPQNGIVLTAKGCTLTLGGPMIFDDIIFKADNSVVNASLNIVGNWNDVTFGGIKQYGGALVNFYAGTYKAKGDDTAAKSCTIKLGGVVNSSANGSATFFATVCLGSWLGEAGQTVSNKRVTLTTNALLNNAGTLTVQPVITTLYTMSTTDDNAMASCLTPDCTTIVNLNDETSVKTLRTGDRNVNEGANYAGAGYLDNLTLNLNNDAVLSGTAILRNVKNAIINISDEAAGRTAANTAAIQLEARGAFAKSMTGTVTATYGEHSFAATVAKPIYESTQTGKYTVSATVAPEHEFGDWSLTTPPTASEDGVETRICAVCGKEETRTISAKCTYHQWLPTTDGYKCAACSETAETLTAPITLKIESVKIADGTATVTVSLAATEALKGLRFRVKVPAGLTYTDATTELEKIPEADAAATPSGFSFGAGTDSMVLLNFAEQTLASFDKNNILTLTYTVAEDFAEKTADFTIELLEVLDDNAETLDADGIGYTWTAQPEEPEVYVAYIGEVGY